MKKTFFRIHFTFFLLLLLGYFTQTIFQILMVYACLTVHELAHVVAARARGIGIQYISVMPFGIAIRLRQDRIRGTADQLLVSLSGPLGNFLFAGVLYVLRSYIPGNIYLFLLSANLSLGLFNLLPVQSLDGGRVSYLLLSLVFGSIIGYNVSVKLSKCMGVLLTIAGAWMVYVTHFNLSLLLLASFLAYQLWADCGYERLVMMQHMLDYKQKKSKTGVYPVKVVAIEDTIPLRRLLRCFSQRKVCVVNVLDREMKIKTTLTEKQVIDLMLYYGAGTCQRETELGYGHEHGQNLKKGAKTSALYRRGVGQRP